MKKMKKIMKFEKFISYFNLNESLKDIRLDKILDKISKKEKLSDSDNEFLNKFDDIKDSDIMDLKMISRDTMFDKINNLLNNNKIVICNLHNKNGKIKSKIKSIFNNFENDTCVIILYNNEKLTLQDNFLYSILYNDIKDEYTLEQEDEFYEKLPITNGN